MNAVDFLCKNALRDNAMIDIVFFGGEPLLMWDAVVEPTIRYVRDELNVEAKLSITTNGTLLNEERLKVMYENRVGILLSADGARYTQDYNRPSLSGNSSFDMLENNFDLILAYFPGTTFRSTIIPKTCGHTWENIEFAIHKGFRTFFTTPNVFEPWNDEDKWTLTEQMRRYSEYFVDSFRRGVYPVMFTSLEQTMKKVTRINAAVFNNEYRTGQSCLSCNKCGLGVGANCSIAPNGDIFACQEFTSVDDTNSPFCIGNIYSGVREEKRLDLVGLYDPMLATGLDCISCKYNRVCDGGCAANNYMINGNVNINPGIYCWWRQLLLSEVEWIIKTLGEEQNETFLGYWRAIQGVG